MFHRVTLAVGCVILLSTFARGQTHPKIQTFDSDPKWDAKNNVTKTTPVRVKQDFGFSRTNHAGGKAAGEMGGSVWRSTTPAYYVRPLRSPKTLNDPLHTSGTFVVMDSESSSSLWFGFCNPQTISARPRNFMGMMLNGESGGTEVHLGYVTNENQSDGARVTGVGPKGARVRDFNKIPDGTVYTWDLRYDPNGNDGAGRITFTLGGSGPYTAKDYVFDIHPSQRKAGCTFTHFGLLNAVSPPGNPLLLYFDDITIDGEVESFDRDPAWLGTGNRVEFDDYDLAGSHRFLYNKDTHYAGGKSKGEIGGLIYSSPANPGYYGDDIGRLTLDDKLVASGRIAINVAGPEAGFYVGWFNSRMRGFPPQNVLGAFCEGPTSTGAQFRGIYASSDPKMGHAQRDGPVIRAAGDSYAWKLEYDPDAGNGHGRLVVWFDDHKSEIVLDPAARKQGAVFDRFGMAIYEGGGQYNRVFLDDLEYTSAAKKDRK